MVAIIPLLILAAILIGLVLGLIMWLTNGSKGYDGEMACGGCGYAVRGLEALNCPECGADLRMVGINRGQSASSRGFGIALTVICGGVLLMGCVLSVLFVGWNRPTPVQSVPLQSMPSPSQSTTTATSPPILIEEESASDAEDEQSSEEDSPGSDQPTP